MGCISHKEITLIVKKLCEIESKFYEASDCKKMNAPFIEVAMEDHHSLYFPKLLREQSSISDCKKAIQEKLTLSAVMWWKEQITIKTQNGNKSVNIEMMRQGIINILIKFIDEQFS